MRNRIAKAHLLLLFLLVLSLKQVSLLDNGFASPAMGWNTWNKYGCSINEDLILKAAQAIKTHGLDELGYNYINIDDCWQAPNRAPNDIPLADPKKFPRGIKDLADEIHKMGLKVGIYSDAGTYTCGKRYGSLGHEKVDAQTYAEWGIDYLKYDNCYNEGLSGTPQISAMRYRTMRDALNATGRPIVYSLCQWGEDAVWNWGWTIANSWRMSGDIYDHFDRPDDRCPCQDSVSYCPLAGFQCSVMNILEKAAGLGQKASSGGWNDLDMLEVGNGGMSYDEYVAHFSMWAFVKSPLILGNDVTNMSKETLSIISNKEIIALNQDKNFDSGYRVWKMEDPRKVSGSIQLWKSSLVNGSYALAFLNATPKKLDYMVSLADFFFDDVSVLIQIDFL
ncbi:family 27 glycoside hydrolase [Melampsora americana]|nr:family 27 glycoside hydrolase [Melampsora americana]